MRPILLDTCTLIFLNEKTPLAASAIAAMRAASSDSLTYISPITAWEISALTSRGRLQLLIRPERWFANLFEVPGVKLAEMSPDLLIASSYLPGTPPRDPFDRIIAATARELGATLITRDRALLDYGAQGHVSVVEC
ncbi:MAG TPA: type II toxin-antitoxin system VapC family toxin [Opitutaceae bacterium]|nr:type II toxin-antitoxin system VapC family toxin [Opitutaceae bacterium]